MTASVGDVVYAPDGVVVDAGDRPRARRRPTIRAVSVPIEDLVFVLGALVGGGLLLMTVLLDDILGGVLDALHIDFSIGGVSLMPPLLAFIAMFGVGGIFATQVLDLHGGPAALVGVGFGVVGFGVAYPPLPRPAPGRGQPPVLDRRSRRPDGSVSVAIPAGRLGTVYVRAEGQTHEISATATEDIPPARPSGRRDGRHGPRRRAHDARSPSSPPPPPTATSQRCRRRETRPMPDSSSSSGAG